MLPVNWARNSSSRPVFTVFRDMDELKDLVCHKAADVLAGYLAKTENYSPLYKQVIIKTIRYAVDHPNLFHLVFLMENHNDINFEKLTIVYKDVIDRYYGILKNDCQLSDSGVRMIYKHSCVYVYGIGSMCAFRVCTFIDEQLNDTLEEVFNAMLMYIKAGKLNEKIPVPVMKKEKKKPISQMTNAEQG